MGTFEKENKKMKEQTVRKIVNELSLKKSPSQIGHILRDLYGIKVHKLTHQFEQLDEDKSRLDKLTLKIRYMQLHLKDNKKDYVTERSLVRLLVEQKKLISKINSKVKKSEK